MDFSGEISVKQESQTDETESQASQVSQTSQTSQSQVEASSRSIESSIEPTEAEWQDQNPMGLGEGDDVNDPVSSDESSDML